MATYGVKLHRSDLLRLEAHPDATTVGCFAEWANSHVANGARLAVDLFSGAGGLSLGSEWAGWMIAASVDHDPFALDTHRANFPGLCLDLDLGSDADRSHLIRILKQAEIDLITGGPPCQPFSRAGRSKIRSLVDAGLRDARDHRRELWRAYLDIVLSVTPRAVIMENVPDMALGDDFRAVRTIIEALEKVGYHTQLRLVDAWRYGVPQHRKRMILLARRDTDQFTWPDEVPKVTLREAISDLPPLNDTMGSRKTNYTAPLEPGLFARRMRKDCESDILWDHMTRAVRADDREIFELMTSNMLYAALPARLRRYKADTFDDKYKRLDWNELSRSITAHIAKDGYWYIHPEEHRTLTVREAARIQTFPDNFRFAGGRSHAFKQIGNAVPPLLGEAAATAVRPISPPPSTVTENVWRRHRTVLSNWAESERNTGNWAFLPGPGLGAATAAVAVLLDPTPDQVSSARHVFAEVANQGKITARALDLIAGLPYQTRAITKALTALRPFLDSDKPWNDLETVPAALGLQPSKAAHFRLLTGDDVLLTTGPVLRVAARALGTTADSKNSLTDGKVDVARLVGGGELAPLRMGALRLISRNFCHPQQPDCLECPLTTMCAFACRRNS